MEIFLISRFSRLYPAYWICVSLTTISIVVSSLIANHNSEGLALRYLANMTMLQYYFNIEDIDGPYWTLIIELIFYLFITLLVISKLLKKIEIISFIIICFIFFYGHYYFAFHYVYILDKLIPLLNYFPLFFSGILFYKLKFEKVTLLRIIMIIICFFAQLYLFKDHYHNRHVINRIENTVVLVVYYSLFILFISGKLGFIVNVITGKLGLISYSLYLMHQFIGKQVLIPYLLNYMNYTFALIITIIFVIGISLVIYTFIEKPALLFIRNQYKSKN